MVIRELIKSNTNLLVGQIPSPLNQLVSPSKIRPVRPRLKTTPYKAHFEFIRGPNS